MKQEIINWFQSPRNYTEGVALYLKYGYNRVLKVRFQRLPESAELRQFLIEALRELGEVPQNIVDSRPLAYTPEPEPEAVPEGIDDLLLKLGAQLGMSVDAIFDPQTEHTDELKAKIETLAPRYHELPETLKKTIRFREEFPFLAEPDCPDVLKILVADMFTAFDKYRSLHAQLVESGEQNNQAENLQLASELIENYLENNLIWNELRYYKEHNKVLGEHPAFEEMKQKAELQNLSDIELSKKLTNVRSNISKSKKKEDTEKLEYWESYLRLLEEEIQKRTPKEE